MNYRQRICRECEKEFYARSTKAVFCSSACRQKHYRENLKTKVVQVTPGVLTAHQEASWSVLEKHYPAIAQELLVIWLQERHSVVTGFLDFIANAGDVWRIWSAGFPGFIENEFQTSDVVVHRFDGN